MEPKSINWSLAEIEKVPNQMGVYWVLDENDNIIYVFRDSNIRRSALRYFKSNESKSTKLKKIKYNLFGKLEDAIGYKLELEEQFVFVLETFDRRMIDVKEIIEIRDHGLNHIALAITITALETYLRDKFKELHFKWFEKERGKNGSEFREKIIEVCREMGKEQEFLRAVFISDANTESAFLEILYKILFPNERPPLIDFQRFKGTQSARWAYNKFLNIDLEMALNTNNSSNWEKLLSYVELRHKIIHGAKEPVDTAIKKSDVEEALDIVEQLKTRIDELTKAEFAK